MALKEILQLDIKRKGNTFQRQKQSKFKETE